jgi:hypothetical protein
VAIGVVVPVAVIAAVVVAAVVVANGKRGRRGDPAGRCVQLHVLGTPTATGSVEHSGDGMCLCLEYVQSLLHGKYALAVIV